MVASYGGWANNNLDFWDPSVAVAAMHPEFVTQSFSHVPVCVNTHIGKVVSAGYDKQNMSLNLFSADTLPYYYGAILVDRPFDKNSKNKRFRLKACEYLSEKSKLVIVDSQLLPDSFYYTFIKQLG